MKIRDFALEKGLTPQAIYKAINRAGLSTKALTTKSGDLTKKGLTQLRLIFSDGEDLDQDQERPESKPADQAEDLRRKISDLESEVADWKKRYFDLVDSADKEREQLRILIDQEQKLRAAAENRGFIRRLFSGKKERDQG